MTISKTIAKVIATEVAPASLCNSTSLGGTCTFLSAASTMAGRVTHRFRFEWRKFELRRVAFTAAWPHARPLTFAWWRFFLTTFTARIVYACSKRDWKV